MKIIAFGASYSKSSINKEFAAFAAHQFEGHDIEILDLNDYPLPLYTTDVEQSGGLEEKAKAFINKLQEADLIIISLAEHNGSYSAGFKNLFDWTSRVKLNMFEGKKLLLLATAPGPWGGRSVLESAVNRFPRHGAELVGQFSLPSFGTNFSATDGIIEPQLERDFIDLITAIKEKI